VFIAVRLSRVVRGVLALAELRVFNPSNVRGCCLRYRELLTMDAYKQTESATLEQKGASVEWSWFQKKMSGSFTRFLFRKFVILRSRGYLELSGSLIQGGLKSF
jgi:hypothetical protein